MSRNTKILRKLEGMLRKECRATLSNTGTFVFRGPHLSDASLTLTLRNLALSFYVLPSFGIQAEGFSSFPSYVGTTFLNRPLWSIPASPVPLSDLYSPLFPDITWPHKRWGPYFSASIIAPAVRKLFPNPCSSGPGDLRSRWWGET